MIYPTEEIRRQLAKKDSEQLAKRLFILTVAFLAAIPLFAAGEIAFGAGAGPLLDVVKLIQVASALAILLGLRVAPGGRRVVVLTVLFAVLVTVTTAASNILRHDVLLTPLLLSMFCVGCAAMFPWEVGLQLLVVVAAAAATLWNEWAVGGSLDALGYPGVAMGIGLVGSVYITHLL